MQAREKAAAERKAAAADLAAKEAKERAEREAIEARQREEKAEADRIQREADEKAAAKFAEKQEEERIAAEEIAANKQKAEASIRADDSISDLMELKVIAGQLKTASAIYAAVSAGKIRHVGLIID